ncbi:hypothetical protein Y023_5123 [Burkholderia pseudomallei A79D]|nr:hypothetical protein X995_628 [Burkholderia pseudomallei B03]AIV95292.1 hypothetical protein X996_581 [Burkholderia pseudomallei A79A]KGX96313.1 hypothetical protein Y023_5123 [Burkholderia pseudomallei A79D]KGX97307.1 hypothetical protein X997_4806 [Burkholderia pseudomallei A79C]
MRSNAHFRLLRLLRLQPRRPARKCAGRGSAPPRSCAADSAQHAYRAIDRLADAWGSWPRRRVDTEPSNPPQTPLPQRINGLSPFPCVLTCVLKPQSHRSYPQANMGCRSWQTSRGTLLRNDRPRRVRAPQRCPDRIHISRLDGHFWRRLPRHTNRSTNRQRCIDRARRESATRLPCLAARRKKFWRVGDKYVLSLVSLIWQGFDYLQDYLQNTQFLGDIVGDSGLIDNARSVRSERPAVWNAPRKEIPRPAAAPGCRYKAELASESCFATEIDDGCRINDPD